MNEPPVCAVMLTRDRPEMARRAIASFEAQTYPAKRLLILDSGSDDFEVTETDAVFWSQRRNTSRPCALFFSPTTTISHGKVNPKTIGTLRNEANSFWTEYPIIVHWDDDDWSHPRRIAEQVALLQSSGADAVGYREMLFWRTEPRVSSSSFAGTEQAWLYSHDRKDYALGTSLCYWRRTWEQKKFADATYCEERWCEGLKVVSDSSMKRSGPAYRYGDVAIVETDPSMIASIHGGNTSTGYDLESYVARGSREWKRVPEWDGFCRERMKL